MAQGIFVSYRRDDSRHAAGRLAGDLAGHFGRDSIFRDIEGIEPGVEFPVALEKALANCVVMVVLIGPQWLAIKNAKGQRRLEQPGDWIRLEIATALERGVRVVPVMVEDTPLPEAEALPADLRPLLQRQTLQLSDLRWDADLARLVQTLAKIPGIDVVKPPSPVPPPPAPGPKAARWKLWAGIGFGVLLLAGLIEEYGGGLSQMPVAMPGPQPAPQLPIAVPSQQAAPRAAPAGDQPVDRTVQARSAATVPDLAGLWRTSSGESYHFAQDGQQLSFTAEAGGMRVGEGRGRLEGLLLRLTMSMRLPNAPVLAVNCNMQAAPDFQSFTGICQGPVGQFPAQFFR